MCQYNVALVNHCSLLCCVLKLLFGVCGYRGIASIRVKVIVIVFEPYIYVCVNRGDVNVLSFIFRNKINRLHASLAIALARQKI